MKNLVVYAAGAVLATKVAKTALLFRFLATNSPPEPDAKFDPAEIPEKTDIRSETNKEFAMALVHLGGMMWWKIKRDMANERMRSHVRYLQHEHEITDFKRELDDENP